MKEADCVRQSVSYSYKDGENYIFMNNDDYSQYEVKGGDIDEQIGFITESKEGLSAMIMDGVLLSIKLPQSVDIEIIDTVPNLKGATATGKTKPAKLSTGMEVQVPEYIEVGEVIKINTGTGKFMSRA